MLEAHASQFLVGQALEESSNLPCRLSPNRRRSATEHVKKIQHLFAVFSLPDV